MNNRFTFALNGGYHELNVKTFAKQVKTKTWVRKYKSQLANTASKLTTAHADTVQVIGCMLQIAFGANIGRQVEDLLSVQDMEKIKANILSVVYS